MSDLIIYEGDFIKDTDGVVSKVVDIRNWNIDSNFECHADCVLANGRVLNSKYLTMEQVFSESEVIV